MFGYEAQPENWKCPFIEVGLMKLGIFILTLTQLFPALRRNHLQSCQRILKNRIIRFWYRACVGCSRVTGVATAIIRAHVCMRTRVPSAPKGLSCRRCPMGRISNAAESNRSKGPLETEGEGCLLRLLGLSMAIIAESVLFVWVGGWPFLIWGFLVLSWVVFAGQR